MQHQEKYTVTWHSYSDHLTEALREMMASSEFADVTIVTDDKQQIRAHRNILSAASPVFKSILQIDSKNADPVIYLRGIQHSEMDSIMQYIYLGEARFYEERMLISIESVIILNISVQNIKKFIHTILFDYYLMRIWIGKEFLAAKAASISRDVCLCVSDST